jgi:hypothetical protein
MDMLTEIKAQAIAMGLKQITGIDPIISKRPDGRILIYFQTKDYSAIRKALQQIVLKAGKTQGDISVSFAPIIAPLALKYVAPVIIGLFLAGSVAGYLIGSGKG